MLTTILLELNEKLSIIEFINSMARAVVRQAIVATVNNINSLL
jgi:hypothetical protein